MRTVAAYSIGFLAVSSILLSAVLAAGSAPEFWVSYVLANISYTGSETLTETLRQVFSFTAEIQILPFYGVCALGSLIFVLGVFQARHVSIGEERWRLIAVLAAYAAAALFAIARPATFFLHYVTFILFPVACFAGTLISYFSSRELRMWLAGSAIVTVFSVPFNVLEYKGTWFAAGKRSVQGRPILDSNTRIAAVVKEEHERQAVTSLLAF